MDKDGRSALASFQRVQEFLTQHPVADAPESLGDQAAELNDAVARLLSESVDQEAGVRFARAHTESERKLRETLYVSHMQPISRIAREVFGASGMDRKFWLPRSIKANQPLIASAGAMAEASETHKDVLLRHGLAQDFIAQLKAAASALDAARNAKVQSGRRRTTATATVKTQLKRGRKAVRLLDAILRPRFAADPQLMAAWESAKRVRPTTVAALTLATPPDIKVA
jgi:hypothetical protein